MTERVLPRSVPDVTVGRDLRHVFCHVCNGMLPGDPVVDVPVTSVCRLCTRTPLAPGTTLPLCVVCVDITNTGRCLAGHPLRTVEEMERDQR